MAAWAATLGATLARDRKAGRRRGRPACARRTRSEGCRGCRAGRGPKRRDLLARRPRTASARWRPTAERRARFAPDELDPAWLEGCDHLFVSGYALLREPVRSAAQRAVEIARAQGSAVSVDLATWSAIRDAGAVEFRDTVAQLAPDVVFANRGRGGDLRRSAPGRAVDREARRARVLVRRRRARRPPGRAGGRHDRRGRRARGRVDRRRARSRARSGRPLRAAGRRDARALGSSARRVPCSSSSARRCARRSTPAMRSSRSRPRWSRTGFPAPDGVEVGLASEAAVREAGAVPATIGVLDGVVRVGLERVRARALHRGLAQGRPARPRCLRGSGRRRRDDGRRSARRRRLGRHPLPRHRRDRRRPPRVPSPPDVSADIPALARARRSSSRSGVKSLLDVPATVELLETLGIPVLGFRTSTLPLFYAAEGGPPVAAAGRGGRRGRPHRRAPTGSSAAPVSCSPSRRPRASTSRTLIESAVSAAAAAGRRGQAVTPFVLSFLHERFGRPHARGQPRADRRRTRAWQRRPR